MLWPGTLAGGASANFAGTQNRTARRQRRRKWSRQLWRIGRRHSRKMPCTQVGSSCFGRCGRRCISHTRGLLWAWRQPRHDAPPHTFATRHTGDRRSCSGQRLRIEFGCTASPRNTRGPELRLGEWPRTAVGRRTRPSLGKSASGVPCRAGMFSPGTVRTNCHEAYRTRQRCRHAPLSLYWWLWRSWSW